MLVDGMRQRGQAPSEPIGLPVVQYKLGRFAFEPTHGFWACHTTWPTRPPLMTLDRYSPWVLLLGQGHGKGQAPPTPRLKLLVLVGEVPIGTLSLEHSKEATPYMLPKQLTQVFALDHKFASTML